MKMERDKILSLQALRVLGFVMIFLQHSHAILPFGVPDLGARGVEIFIVLSGFTMAYNHCGEKMPLNLRASLSFCIKRVKKFYLLHLITFMAAAFLVVKGFLKTNHTFVDTVKLTIEAILNLLLLQSWVPNIGVCFSFNSVSWFLSTLIFCYFVTPLILHIIEKLETPYNWIKLSVLILLFKMVFETVWIKYVGWNSDYIFHISPLYRVLEYIVGCLFGAIFLSEKAVGNNQNNFVSTIMEIIAIIFYIVVVIAGKPSWERAYYIFFVILLIYNLAIGKGIVSKLFKNKIILHLSTISLELFMIHQLVILYTYEIFSVSKFIPDNAAIKRIEFWLMLIVTLLISELMHYILRYTWSKRKTMNIKA